MRNSIARARRMRRRVLSDAEQREGSDSPSVARANVSLESILAKRIARGLLGRERAIAGRRCRLSIGERRIASRAGVEDPCELIVTAIAHQTTIRLIRHWADIRWSHKNSREAAWWAGCRQPNILASAQLAHLEGNG